MQHSFRCLSISRLCSSPAPNRLEARGDRHHNRCPDLGWNNWRLQCCTKTQSPRMSRLRSRSWPRRREEHVSSVSVNGQSSRLIQSSSQISELAAEVDYRMYAPKRRSPESPSPQRRQWSGFRTIRSVSSRGLEVQEEQRSRLSFLHHTRRQRSDYRAYSVQRPC